MRPARTPEMQARINALVAKARADLAPPARDGRPAPRQVTPDEQLEETRARVAVDFPVLSEEAIAICTRGREE